jgi:hypothetical protein
MAAFPCGRLLATCRFGLRRLDSSFTDRCPRTMNLSDQRWQLIGSHRVVADVRRHDPSRLSTVSTVLRRAASACAALPAFARA